MVWNFIRNKVHPLFAKIGIRRKAMQRHSAVHSVFLSSEDLYRLVSALTYICFSRYLQYMCESVGVAKNGSDVESVGGAKQAVM